MLDLTDSDVSRRVNLSMAMQPTSVGTRKGASRLLSILLASILPR